MKINLYLVIDTPATPIDYDSEVRKGCIALEAAGTKAVLKTGIVDMLPAEDKAKYLEDKQQIMDVLTSCTLTVTSPPDSFKDRLELSYAMPEDVKTTVQGIAFMQERIIPVLASKVPGFIGQRISAALQQADNYRMIAA